MGFAKYREDDFKIFEDRMYYKEEPSYSFSYLHIKPAYSKPAIMKGSSYHCPFCSSVFDDFSKRNEHAVNRHGGKVERLYLNGKDVTNLQDITVTAVHSLVLYSFRNSTAEITIKGDYGVHKTVNTNPKSYSNYILAHSESRRFSKLSVITPDQTFIINQHLDISSVSIDNIRNRRYISDLFIDQVSQDLLDPDGCLVFLKMLLSEGEDITYFYDYVSGMFFDYQKPLDELYLYFSLSFHEVLYRENLDIKKETIQALLKILNGDYSKALNILSAVQRCNDKYGCLFLLYALTNNPDNAYFSLQRYKKKGLLGNLVSIIEFLINFRMEESVECTQEMFEVELFKEYPLIKALLNFVNSILNNEDLEKDSYTLLRGLTPLAATLYCRKIKDPGVREKIYKSMLKIHKDSFLIKQISFDSRYRWVTPYISVKDGPLYFKAVLDENKKFGNRFSESFLKNFPYDDEIQFTALGGQRKIGASCFIISYHGINIMLDCGIDPANKESEAYPSLDDWDRSVDYIILSHAHIDHSGGIPKAFSMWPNANIIMTEPTKIFLQYLYSDMAKVVTGFGDDFEIENLTIEKEAMKNALLAIDTVDYEQWINIGDEVDICLHNAGHIMGAAMVELKIHEKTILYTGDFSTYPQSITEGIDYHYLPNKIDYLISEATYINPRRYSWKHQIINLQNEILDSLKNGQSIILPSSAIGRSQELTVIIGEMKYNGLIPDDVDLFIGGMATPATTQIIPYLNDHYKDIVGQFYVLDKFNYPIRQSIVIASSGTMASNSAAGKLYKRWISEGRKIKIIAGGYLDEDGSKLTLSNMSNTMLTRCSLATHADQSAIIELIKNTAPKVLTFVHQGDSEYSIAELEKKCKELFSGDLVIYDSMVRSTGYKVFDLLNNMRNID